MAKAIIKSGMAIQSEISSKTGETYQDTNRNSLHK